MLYIKDSITNLRKAYKSEESAQAKLTALTFATVKALTELQVVAIKLDCYGSPKKFKATVTKDYFGIEDLSSHPQKSAIYNKFKCADYVIKNNPAITQTTDNIEDIRNALDSIFNTYESYSQLLKLATAKPSPVASTGAATSNGGAIPPVENLPSDDTAAPNPLELLKEITPQFLEVYTAAVEAEGVGEAFEIVRPLVDYIYSTYNEKYLKAA